MSETPDLDHCDELPYRISGPEGAPPVVYLPGLQGDWTAMGFAQPLLSRRLRLVEVAYPRRPDWSLADHARAVAARMDGLAIESAHLLAESYGSLVAWELGLARPERVRSLIQAAGFCQPPQRPLLPMWRFFLGLIPAPIWGWSIDAFVRWKHWQGACRTHDPPGGQPFAASRTRRGMRAVGNRLTIIHQTDVRDRLDEVRFPVAYIGGARDIIVPVRREIKTLQRMLDPACRFRHRLIPRAPHAILPARARQVAEFTTEWIEEVDRG